MVAFRGEAFGGARAGVGIVSFCRVGMMVHLIIQAERDFVEVEFGFG